MRVTLTHTSATALLDHMLEEAFVCKASDIHIDPREDEVLVRLRIDGELRESFSLPFALRNEIISRIKVLARLRTDLHDTPQDGRFRHTFKGQTADIRVSIAPTYYGENAVLRLLADLSGNFSLANLGFGSDDEANIRKVIQRSCGMILVTGPTGSGKTTTLYTLLSLLSTGKTSIITIEDPIEYALTGIRQIQVNPHKGLSFAAGLKSIVRQDPEVIMVGEIRDQETAAIAINCALTGHLVLSTLHTNDAAATFPRLLDMGIEPYLVASTASLVINQRLVRKICTACKTIVEPTHEQKILMEHSLSSNRIWKGHGCDACQGSGLRGRTAIAEVLTVDEHIRESIMQRKSAADIHRLAATLGMRTLVTDAALKVQDGITTLEEIIPLLHEL